MALKHILLGLLGSPASGYDLKREFNQSLTHFWGAELSQIYPLLDRLEAQGLLKSRRSASEKGPARRVYRRTAKGTRALREWLSAGPEFGGNRIPFLAQVYFLNQLEGNDGALGYLEKLRTKIETTLGMLRSIESGWRADDPRYPDELSDEDFFPQLTLSAGISTWQARLDWCEQSIARLRRREHANKKTVSG